MDINKEREKLARMVEEYIKQNRALTDEVILAQKRRVERCIYCVRSLSWIHVKRILSVYYVRVIYVQTVNKS